MSQSHGEYDERLAKMMASMDAHIEADRVAFASLIEELKEVNQDVKSIIAARNYASGVWKAITIGAAVIVFLVTAYLMYHQGGH